MHDWAGWLLLLFSFSIVLMWKSIRDDTKIVHAIWLCLVLHHAVVFFNVSGGFFSYLYFPDAATAHWNGAHLAAMFEPEWFSQHKPSGEGFFHTFMDQGDSNYITFLAFLYHAFGTSLFFGSELSVLAFVLSCVVLIKLVDHLDLRRFRVGIVLLFGLLPSAVIYRSVTLRESWQALSFLLFVYLAIRLWKRPCILNISFLLMSAYCMSLLHHGLARYAVYLVIISVYWSIAGRKKSARWARHLRFLFAGILVVCVILLTQKAGWFMTVEQALENVAETRQSLLAIKDVRTVYSFTPLDTSSVYGLVTTIPAVFVNYMFAPFPWQVESVKDVWVLLESMLRFVLLFFAISLWRRSSGGVRSCYGFLLIIILGIELVWALGTVNWGTAIRHHIPGYGVIVLLGAPRLILFMRKLHSEMFGRRKDSTMLPE
jgi:hypothetical protein